jgi:hypothetical protein
VIQHNFCFTPSAFVFEGSLPKNRHFIQHNLNPIPLHTGVIGNVRSVAIAFEPLGRLPTLPDVPNFRPNAPKVARHAGWHKFQPSSPA